MCRLKCRRKSYKKHKCYIYAQNLLHKNFFCKTHKFTFFFCNSCKFVHRFFFVANNFFQKQTQKVTHTLCQSTFHATQAKNRAKKNQQQHQKQKNIGEKYKKGVK